MWYGMGVPRVYRPDGFTVREFLERLENLGPAKPPMVNELRWGGMLNWFRSRFTNGDWIIDEETGERY